MNRYNIRPKKTTFAGTTYRSRLEARWAVFFTALHVPFIYEPSKYVTPFGGYIPDFWLPNDRAFIEIKGPTPLIIELYKLGYIVRTVVGATSGYIFNDIPDASTWRQTWRVHNAVGRTAPVVLFKDKTDRQITSAISAAHSIKWPD